jgi:hypothetical protein
VQVKRTQPGPRRKRRQIRLFGPLLIQKTDDSRNAFVIVHGLNLAPFNERAHPILAGEFGGTIYGISKMEYSPGENLSTAARISVKYFSSVGR